jgi:branched-chain amino acid transport system permease protein
MVEQSVLLQQLINGFTLGFIYALIALGYTMVYGIVRLINFAHGDMLMIGAYTGYFVLKINGATPVSLILALVISMAVCAVLGVSLERVCYKPLRGAPRINILIVAIGASFVLENGSRILPFMGPNPREFPQLASSPETFLIAGQKVVISVQDYLVFGVSLLLMLSLGYIVKFTKIGKAMRAVSYDMKAASLMGINVNRIISYTFAIGSAMAAVAGVLYASKYPQVQPYMGIMPGLKAFVAAVLGGIGSIPGAMLGGLILGITEILAKGYISSKMSDAVVFGILILILMFRPTGIMGKSLKEKV